VKQVLCAAAVLCAVAGSSALSVTPAGAATEKILYVNQSGVANSGCTEPGAKACATIAEAIIAAAAYPADDVTILVGPGTYAESDDIESIEPGTTLAITGSGQASTVIEGEDSGIAIVTINSEDAPEFGAVSINDVSLNALDGGSAVVAEAATVTLARVTLSAPGAHGGGGILGLDTDLELSNDTLADDSAASVNGGAIAVIGGSLTMSNSTISNGAQQAGGMYVEFATAHLTDDTIAGESSTTNDGTGIAETSSSVTVSDSILDGAPCSREQGTITDRGHNVESDDSCGFGRTSIVNSSHIDLARQLAANNSSGPPTLAIAHGSVAIGEVPRADCLLRTDERGEPRRGAPGGSCDAGAFELQLPPTPPMQRGYYLAGANGAVFAFGGARLVDSLATLDVHVDDIVAVAGVSTSTRAGYYLVGADGAVFAFGDARFFGSLPELGVRVDDIVAIAIAPDDDGYWLVGSDGAVFAFGHARYQGSLPGLAVHVHDIVGLAMSKGGHGYWLAGALGTVYDFAAAPSGGDLHYPVVAIAGTADGGGYFLTGPDGAVFGFGDAAYRGSLPEIGVYTASIVAFAASTTGRGYLVVGRNGGVYAFGNAAYSGSLPQLGARVNDVVGAATA
jgi:hypothetical protein